MHGSGHYRPWVVLALSAIGGWVVGGRLYSGLGTLALRTFQK
jgi:hypothetical protein